MEFDAFRDLVLGDPELQRQLLAVKEAEPFTELAARLAQERGIDLTPTDILWALQDARQSWHERTVAGSLHS
jgi:hypothetical protein